MGSILPLALLSFCLVTAKAVVVCVDGPDEKRFGFPFFWLMPGPTSLSWIIDGWALVIDFMVYLLVWALLSQTKAFVKLFSWRKRLLLAVLCIAMALICGSYLLLLSRDVSAGGVSFNRSSECQRIKDYSLQLGFPR